MKLYSRIAIATLAGMAGAAATQPALAGHDCGGHAVACYERVRQPDVYRTVERPVVLEPERVEVIERPAIIGTSAERVVVAPGRIHRIEEPAIFSTIVRREMVAPAEVTYRHVPPVVETVRQKVVVREGHQRWHYRRDRHGRMIKCLVRSRPVTRTVTRQVVVHPGATIPFVAPALYRDVPRTVLVQPAHVRHIVEPPVTEIIRHDVVLRPAERHVITHPPVIGVERASVRVRHGGWGWQPIRERW